MTEELAGGRKAATFATDTLHIAPSNNDKSQLHTSSCKRTLEKMQCFSMLDSSIFFIHHGIENTAPIEMGLPKRLLHMSSLGGNEVRGKRACRGGVVWHGGNLGGKEITLGTT